MAEEKRDYYEVLGLQKGASEEEIKKAFKTMARKYVHRRRGRPARRSLRQAWLAGRLRRDGRRRTRRAADRKSVV